MSAAAKSLALAGATEAADRRRRIVAIVGASSGNLVEWYDFYAYAFTSIYFAAAFFPDRRYDQSAYGDGRNFRGRLLHAAASVAGYSAGSPTRMAGKNSMVISVLMMCAGSLLDRHHAHLRDHRRRRHRSCCSCRPPGAGPFGRWRVRDRRDLHERGGVERASWLLFLLPVRDADRRTASGASGACWCCKRF